METSRSRGHRQFWGRGERCRGRKNNITIRKMGFGIKKNHHHQTRVQIPPASNQNREIRTTRQGDGATGATSGNKSKLARTVIGIAPEVKRSAVIVDTIVGADG